MFSKHDLKDWMKESLGIGHHEIDDETPLFSSGLLDSFDLLQIVAFVEEKTGSKLNIVDVNMQSFDSIARIMMLRDRIAEQATADG